MKATKPPWRSTTHRQPHQASAVTRNDGHPPPKLPEPRGCRVSSRQVPVNPGFHGVAPPARTAGPSRLKPPGPARPEPLPRPRPRAHWRTQQTAITCSI